MKLCNKYTICTYNILYYKYRPGDLMWRIRNKIVELSSVGIIPAFIELFTVAYYNIGMYNILGTHFFFVGGGGGWGCCSPPWSEMTA